MMDLARGLDSESWSQAVETPSSSRST